MKPCLALALLNSFNVLKRVKVLLIVINVKNGRVYKVSHHLTNMEHNSNNNNNYLQNSTNLR